MIRLLYWGLVIPLLINVHANLLIPGIMKEEVKLVSGAQEYVGFLQSALEETEVEVRLRCQQETNFEFEVRFVIRSSPCSKEFFVDTSRFSQVSNLLVFLSLNIQRCFPL